MKAYDQATLTALQNREAIAPFNLLWIEAKNRDNGGLEAIGFWNGLDVADVTVINPETNLPTVRTYYGAGSLLDIPAIPQESDLTIRSIRILLSQVDAATQLAVRGYDVRLAPIQVHRGYFDVDTMQPVAPARARFIGWVNNMKINTPAVGGSGNIELTCVSHTRQLTKTNPLRRSDEQQKRRQGDRFRRHTDVAGEWLQNVFWGEAKK